MDTREFQHILPDQIAEILRTPPIRICRMLRQARLGEPPPFQQAIQRIGRIYPL